MPPNGNCRPRRSVTYLSRPSSAPQRGSHFLNPPGPTKASRNQRERPLPVGTPRCPHTVIAGPGKAKKFYPSALHNFKNRPIPAPKSTTYLSHPSPAPQRGSHFLNPPGPTKASRNQRERPLPVGTSRCPHTVIAGPGEAQHIYPTRPPPRSAGRTS